MSGCQATPALSSSADAHKPFSQSVTAGPLNKPPQHPSSKSNDAKSLLAARALVPKSPNLLVRKARIATVPLQSAPTPPRLSADSSSKTGHAHTSTAAKGKQAIRAALSPHSPRSRARVGNAHTAASRLFSQDALSSAHLNRTSAAKPASTSSSSRAFEVHHDCDSEVNELEHPDLEVPTKLDGGGKKRKLTLEKGKLVLVDTKGSKKRRATAPALEQHSGPSGARSSTPAVNKARKSSVKHPATPGASVISQAAAAAALAATSEAARAETTTTHTNPSVAGFSAHPSSTAVAVDSIRDAVRSSTPVRLSSDADSAPPQLAGLDESQAGEPIPLGTSSRRSKDENVQLYSSRPHSFGGSSVVLVDEQEEETDEPEHEKGEQGSSVPDVNRKLSERLMDVELKVRLEQQDTPSGPAACSSAVDDDMGQQVGASILSTVSTS